MLVPRLSETSMMISKVMLEKGYPISQGRV